MHARAAHAPLPDRARPQTAFDPATLIYMPTEHEPVLATELTDLLAPQPGQVAVDCTFGGGGHARRIADRLGPRGTLIAIDRDPAAEPRFERFAAEVPCKSRFIGSDYSAGCLLSTYAAADEATILRSQVVAPS